MANGQRHRKSGAFRALQAIFALLMIGCLGLAAYVFLILPEQVVELEEQGPLVFAQGIVVEGMDLGGKTIEDATYILSGVENGLVSEIYYQLDTPEESITLTYADFNITYDTDAILQEAILLGNTGSRKDMEEERAALLESPREYSLSYTIDVSTARPKIEQLAEKLNKTPVDARVEMDMEVDGWFRYYEGVAGETLDTEALLATLEQRAQNAEYGLVELPILYTEAEVTVEKLQSSLTRRSKAETSFRKSPYNREDRVYNVKKAASLINGCVLKPGEEFSTNDMLGPRTYELGWKPAPAYVNGATEDQAGGGVCQVSSTLYNAIVKADLEIVFRRNHSSTVSYVPYGLDATINTGTIDFQFKNNTNADIYIFAYTIDKADAPVPEGQDDKTLHVEVFGEALGPEYDKIELTSEKIETLKPSGEMEIIVDTTVAWDYVSEEVKRRDGAVYQSYKHYYKDGVEIREKEPLAKSTYRAFAGRIVVGQGYVAGQTATQ